VAAVDVAAVSVAVVVARLRMRSGLSGLTLKMMMRRRKIVMRMKYTLMRCMKTETRKS
jgi:hypothetical protein